MKNNIFDTGMRMIDVISYNYKLLLLLSRFNINMGFGDRKIEDICNENNVSPELFVLICNIYTFDNYIPTDIDIKSFYISELIDYLKRSHDYYFNTKLSDISNELSHITSNLDEKYSLALEHFFTEYKEEVDKHFKYEEEIVFPYVMSCDNNSDFSITTFEENHSNIEDKVNDLKNILIKYLPSGKANKSHISILFNLFMLEEDLGKHCMIEEKVLVPVVMKMEKNGK